MLHARLCFAVAYLGLMTMAAMNKKSSSLSPPDQLATKEPLPAAPPLLHAPSPDTQQKPIIARASGPTLSRVCDGATAGHNPHQSPAARLLFPRPLPLAPGWLSLALGSLTRCSPRLPDSSDTQPALPPNHRARLCSCASPLHSDRIRPRGFEPSGLRSVELF